MHYRKSLVVLILLIISFAGYAQDTIAPNEQRDVLEKAARLIESRYVDESKAAAIAAEIRKKEVISNVSLNAQEFAKQATVLLRKISNDGHLGISYSAKPIAPTDGERGYTTEEMKKWYGAHINHGVEKIERFSNGVILLDLRVFPPAEMGADVISAAMTTVAEGSALIIDLRKIMVEAMRRPIY